jgi:sterol-4alpha-carboxylate 3-dehydrogenase (decarboxylating)
VILKNSQAPHMPGEKLFPFRGSLGTRGRESGITSLMSPPSSSVCQTASCKTTPRSLVSLDAFTYAASMAGARLAVTGGYGFVGSAIVSALNDQFPGCEIIIFDKSTNQCRPDVTSRLRNIQVDITFPRDVKAAFEQVKPDLVIHSAGYVPPLSKRYSRELEKSVQEVNVYGTQHVLDAALESKCRGLIYTSSCCAVTDDLTGQFANIDERWPVSPKSLIYGESKVVAEKLVLSANSDSFATCVLRPAVIFGEVC